MEKEKNNENKINEMRIKREIVRMAKRVIAFALCQYDDTHVFSKHWRMSRHSLRMRAMDEHRDATSFWAESYDSFEKAIKRVLATEYVRDEISKYLAMTPEEAASDGLDRDGVHFGHYVIIVPMPGNIRGYGYAYGRGHEWRNGPMSCERMAIVIKRNEAWCKEVRQTNRISWAKPFEISSIYPIIG